MSDIPIQKHINSTSPNSKFLMSRRNSVRFLTPSHDESNYADNSSEGGKDQMNRRGSVDKSDGFEPDAHAIGDLTPQQSSKQMAPQNSARMPLEVEGYVEDAPRRKPRVVFTDQRQLSAREAVADQEAAEAEAAAKAQREEEDEDNDEDDDDDDDEGGGGGQVKMSLMDLLEETDRQMGVVGSRYAIDNDEEVACEEEEDDDGGGGIEHTCCICMVKHKGAAFIPCGHTFCRLCSREQGVQRGNCPLCNSFILEMLDIF